MNVVCDNCGKVHNQTPYHMKKYVHHFCSRDCTVAYRKIHGAFNRGVSVDKVTRNFIKKLAEIRKENIARGCLQGRYLD
jgi:hypothetical protein